MPCSFLGDYNPISILKIPRHRDHGSRSWAWCIRQAAESPITGPHHKLETTAKSILTVHAILRKTAR